MSDPRTPGPLEAAVDPDALRGGPEEPVRGAAATGTAPDAPATSADRIAALEALGLDRDVAVAALKALGETVDEPPDGYIVNATIVGPELRELLEDALERNATDEPRMNATAADALGLDQAIEYDAAAGSLTLRFEVASEGPLNALDLVEQAVEFNLRALGLEALKAEELGARLAAVHVAVSGA